MKHSEEKAVEQYPICSVKLKKEPKFGFIFWFNVVRFFVNLCALIDKYWPKILNLFEIDME